MENPKPQLPLDIVMYIQTLVNARDAARMATVSKSLYASWSSRKNVEFDERHFRRASTFWECAENSLVRYKDAGLRIETFTFRIKSNHGDWVTLDDMLVQAVNQGAHSIIVECMSKALVLFLPGVVFSSANLINLSIKGGTYVFGVLDSNLMSSIESLHFNPAKSVGGNNDFMNAFFWRSPKLKKLICRGHMLSFDKGQLGYGTHCLESLTLEDLHSKDAEFFEDMCRLLPYLKTLCIRGMYNCQDLRINSQSLERITVYANAHPVDAVFNTPKLGIFIFQGGSSSRLKFESHSPELVSDVCIPFFHNHFTWLAGVKQLLLSLAASKIAYLCIHVSHGYQSFATCKFEESTLDVERLVVRSAHKYPGIVKCLHQICRPNEIVREYGTK